LTGLWGFSMTAFGRSIFEPQATWLKARCSLQGKSINPFPAWLSYRPISSLLQTVGTVLISAPI